MVIQLPNDGKATASAKYGIPEEIEQHLPDTLLGSPTATASRSALHHRTLQPGSLAPDIGHPRPKHLDVVQEARSMRFRVSEPDHQDERVRALSGGCGRQGCSDQKVRVDGVWGVMP